MDALTLISSEVAPQK